MGPAGRPPLTPAAGTALSEPWPADDHRLVTLQQHLGHRAAQLLAAAGPAALPADPLVAATFVAFARGEAGPGHPGDRAWAAATAWRPPPGDPPPRRGDEELRGQNDGHQPRRAEDLVDQAVVSQRVPAAYAPGLLARREGPVLAAALDALAVAPDVVLVDATGLDHPRRAGLALHVGAASGLPTVGVTHRGLVVREPPADLPLRGDSRPVELDGQRIGAWVCTRTGTRPLLVHAAWLTDAATAIDVVLRTSTEAARTPVPLQEARRAAREARALAGAG